MKKKFLSFILALIIALSFSVTAFGGPGGGVPPWDSPRLVRNSSVVIPDPICLEETEETEQPLDQGGD